MIYYITFCILCFCVFIALFWTKHAVKMQKKYNPDAGPWMMILVIIFNFLGWPVCMFLAKRWNRLV